MNNYNLIISKQTQWALNRGINLQGSEGNRGALTYAEELNQNLFMPLLPSVEESFIEGNGGEINSSPEKPAKMQAVHSSSALAVNVFQYWEKINQVPVIAAECGFCANGNLCSENIAFEKKLSIGISNRIPPHLDIVIQNNEASRFKIFAVECKFTEAYSSEGHGGLAQAYLDDSSIWSDIPNLRDFAGTICPDDNSFKYLHAAQLVKHILGLKHECKSKDKFKLLYLWYDAFGQEGANHRYEIEQFSNISKADDIHFLAMTYQELICQLAKNYRDQHTEYIKYLTDRYL